MKVHNLKNRLAAWLAPLSTIASLHPGVITVSSGLMLSKPPTAARTPRRTE